MFGIKTSKECDLRELYIKSAAFFAVIIPGKECSPSGVDSVLTNAWIANGGSNNMWIHKRDGHTRANYSENVNLRYDGQSNDSKDSVLLVGQFEKYNDFVFPTQGPRSF